MRRQLLMLLVGTMALGSVSVVAPGEVLAQRVGSVNSLQDAMKRGDYELAGQLASRHDDPASLIVRSKLAVMKGDYADARRFAEVALEKSTRAEDVEAATLAVAQHDIRDGKLAEAEESLRAALMKNPFAHGVRLELGELLWSQGKRDAGREILDQFSTFFNNGRLTTAHGLTSLGLAMHRLDSFDDANYAFEQAYKADQDDPTALAEWGMLFLEKYNIADADVSFKEALEINPNHVKALVGAGMVEMMTSRQSDNARAFFDRARAIAPRDPELLAVMGHLAMNDADYELARKHAEQILADNARDLEALAILAAVAYIEDDFERFTELRDKALAINPKSGDLLATVGEYGVRVHRYVKAMEIYRAALEIEPENARALLGLGIGLSRIHKEDEAVEILRRAFDVDPYNVRAYNMLELYDKTMPNYSFRQYPDFRLRAHNDQFDMIDMFVSPVVSDSISVYKKKYNFAPDKELAVEIFPNPTTFSVRSVGVPSISPHGICFGQVVTMRSPSDGNFNWRQVVWHEMAHVFHIQLSKARVPRWFTEGLAEYETNVWDPSWRRHHNKELAAVVFAGEIPSVLELDYGFTHARSQIEVLRAYHLASLAVHFVAEEFGFDKVVGMLRGWAEYNDTVVVLDKVLGVDVETFDKKLLAWLELRLLNFNNQKIVDFESMPSPEQLARKIKLNQRDAFAHAQLAWRSFRAGDFQRGESLLAQALDIDPDSADVNMIAMTVRLQQQRARDVLLHGEKVLGAFRDSYDLRVGLGIASLDVGDTEGAIVHLEAALQMHEDGGYAWVLLSQLAKGSADAELLRRATVKLFDLDAHNPTAAMELYQLASGAGDAALIWAAIERWQDTNPFDPRLHRATIDSADLIARDDQVARAWRALIALRPDEKESLYREARDFMSARPAMSAHLEELEARAADDGVTF